MSRAARILLVALAITTLGCIRRYPAPEDQAPAKTPYTALALYLEVLPPIAADAPPLPSAALRLGFHGDAEVFADAALIDGPEHAAIAETWPAALALLKPRTEPIVLLASAIDAARCAQLAPLAERILVAHRGTDAPLHPIESSEDEADALGGRPLTELCVSP